MSEQPPYQPPPQSPYSPAPPPPPPGTGSYYPAPGFSEEPRRGIHGLAVAGFVLAILGLVLCWFPALGIVLALVSLGLAIPGFVLSRRQQRPRGLSIAGLIISIIAVVLGVIFSVIYVLAGVEAANKCTDLGLEGQAFDACIDREIEDFTD
jgi:hypothetical protein